MYSISMSDCQHPPRTAACTNDLVLDVSKVLVQVEHLLGLEVVRVVAVKLTVNAGLMIERLTCSFQSDGKPVDASCSSTTTRCPSWGRYVTLMGCDSWKGRVPVMVRATCVLRVSG
jgi:hypothetical protein